MNTLEETKYFGTEKILKILLKLAPPVMLSQLILALYNIVDSFFIGKISNESLNALSVIYPLQFFIMALSIGTSVGVNTVMSKYFGMKKLSRAKEVAGLGNVLAIISWIVFSLVILVILKPYIYSQTNSSQSRLDALTYGYVICICSIFSFLEANFSKVNQAHGKMVIPMIAQITGAIINIILDPLLIFTFNMGVLGAAMATIIGQFISAIIVLPTGYYRPSFKNLKSNLKSIYKAAVPSIIMQSLYTFYIMGLNMILVRFCDEAVTVLGIYYKIQNFFFVPLNGLHVVIIPILSYNYAIDRYDRCRIILKYSILISAFFMIIGILCFVLFPTELIGLFSKNLLVLEIGKIAFRLISLSFIPIVFSLTFPVFFQAIGCGIKSIILSVLRQIVLFVPIGFLLSLLGLNYFWLTYIISEIITLIVGVALYISQNKLEKRKMKEVIELELNDYNIIDD